MTMHWPVTPQDKYLHDNSFKALVDQIESMLHGAQYTPTELREAVILAAIHFDLKQPRPIHLHPFKVYCECDTCRREG